MRDLFIKTDKDYINTLPRFAFNGRIEVVQDIYGTERAVRALRKSKLLGIDTETRPAFKRGEHHKDALLQIATTDICFLFRLNILGLPEVLQDLLSAPHIIKVGLSLHDDIAMLRRREPDFNPQGFIELQTYAKEMGLEDMSLQKLYANVFHRRISKSARLSNWEATQLTDAQKVYAATDAVTCIHLYNELKALRESNGYVLLRDEQPIAQ